MAQQHSIEFVLSAIDRNVKGAFAAVSSAVNRGLAAVQAFNKTANNGIKIMGSLESAIGGVAGAYLGLHGIGSVVSLMQKASTASFTLESSLKAASRQFSNTGSMQQWEGALGRLSGQLQIYSNSDLRIAAAKTVDMTKRLGLSSDQMERMIALTGDLSAGRTDLSGGIERVTAALRGEAEASEYLGLTLNENYVKSWYQARGATQGAWKDLNDMQKAQIRYQVFLEQAIPVQGKAAESVKTFGGALQMVRTNIEDAISGSADVTEAMANMATVLRDNGKQIGALVSSIITWASKVVEIGIKYQDLIITIGKVVGVLYGLVKAGQAIGVITNIVKGLHSAFVVLTERSVTKWASDTVASLRQMASGANFLGKAIRGVAGVFAAWEIGSAIGNWLNQFAIVRKAGVLLSEELTIAFLKIKKAWTWVTGGDTAAVQKEIDDAKKTYSDMFNEIGTSSEKMADTAEKSYGRIKTKAELTADEIANANKKITDSIDKTEQTAENPNKTPSPDKSPSAATPPAAGQPAPFVSTMAAATPKEAPALNSPADPSTTKQAIDGYDQIAGAAEDSAGRQEKAMSGASANIISALSAMSGAGKAMFSGMGDAMSESLGKTADHAASDPEKTPEERLAAMQEEGDAMMERAKESLGGLGSSDMSGMMGGMSMDIGAMLGAASQRMEERRRQRVQNTPTPTGDPGPAPDPTYDTPSTDHNHLVNVNGEWRNVSDADVAQNNIQKGRMKSAAEEDAGNTSRAATKKGLGDMPVSKVHKIEIGGATAYVDNDEQAEHFINELRRQQMRS